MRLPTRPDTAQADVKSTWCTWTGNLGTIIVEQDGKLVQIDLNMDRRLRSLILFGPDNGDGWSELRWSPELERLETFSQARRRWQQKNWTGRAVEAVLAEQIYVGMNPEMVRESWGTPRRINRTTTARGRREQWVYANSYVYLENGRVTAIQN